MKIKLTENARPSPPLPHAHTHTANTIATATPPNTSPARDSFRSSARHERGRMIRSVFDSIGQNASAVPRCSAFAVIERRVRAPAHHTARNTQHIALNVEVAFTHTSRPVLLSTLHERPLPLSSSHAHLIIALVPSLAALTHALALSLSHIRDHQYDAVRTWRCLVS